MNHPASRLGPRVPYHPGSPWPCMRGNPRGTGTSPLVGGDTGFEPAAEMVLRRWRTGNGIFSTPVVGADETIYVGSADKRFYALDPVSGEQRWSFETGECIDCAGCIAEDGTIYFVSCDAGLYGLTPDGEETWRLNVFEDRQHYTPSTIYWWEANVVLGPSGDLYAGNDDFNFYAIEPGRGVRWAHQTGLHIWTAPAMDETGAVYFASFDLHLYALELDSGKVRWRAPTGNFIASSPAVAPDGSIVFGSFDGRVHALDPRRGHTRWQIATGGPIYGSPAIAADGTVYVGSSDGCLYAIDPGGPRVRWTFYTGDALRCSAALGPDPERESPYLIYFGGGNGLIYALDPDGQRRWSLDTRVGADGVDYPNINASMALGRTGVSTAAASGDVFFVPYHLYLEAPKTPGLDRRPDDGYPASGTHLYYVTPGGSIVASPLGEEAAGDDGAPPVEASQALSFRVLTRRDGTSLPTRLDPDGLDVRLDPPRPHRVLLHPDRGQLDVVPVRPSTTDEPFEVDLRAGFEAGDERGEVRGRFRAEPLPRPAAPTLEELPERPFRITHMSIFDPPIVPSFDQIGIASLTVHTRVVHVDPERGKFVAWGLQKFGMDERGEHVQIAVPRALLWALAGSYDDGRAVLTARNLHFELTAFPVPLDTLRFSGSWDGDAGPGAGASMVAECDVVSRFRVLRRWVQRIGKDRKKAEEARAPRHAGPPVQWSKLLVFAQSWVPDLRSLGSVLPGVLRSLTRTIPLAWRVPRREMYGPWGLIGEDGWFRGAGTFRTSPDPGAALPDVDVARFAFDTVRNQAVAEIALRGGEEFGGAVPGILIVDTDVCEPLALDYDGATVVTRDEERRRWRVALSLPRSFDVADRRWKAYLLLDLRTLAALELSPPSP